MELGRGFGERAAGSKLHCMALIKPTAIALDGNAAIVQQTKELLLLFMFGILYRNNTESWCSPWTELAADSWKFWG